MSEKISVNGQPDARLAMRVADRSTATPLPDTHADLLANAQSAEEYQASLMRLLREQHAVDCTSISIPRSPGFLGTIAHVWRKWCWKLMRYQHEQVSIRHNAVHALLVSAMEHAEALKQSQLEEMKNRLDQLEAQHPTSSSEVFDAE